MPLLTASCYSLAAINQNSAMDEQKGEIINKFLLERTSLLEIILNAIFIGIGIEFIASSSFNLAFKDNPKKDLNFLVIGLIIILVAFIYFFIRFFGNRVSQKVIKGILFVSNKNNELINCEGYRIAEDLHRFVGGACSEDKAFKKNFDNFFAQKDRDKGFELISQAIEYFLIERLSTHLTDFYNDKRFNKEHIKEFNRNDIPAILLSNRFLELFSKPMNQRSAFYEEEHNNNDSGGTVVYGFGPNGEIYSRFDLVLPKNSKVTRGADNSITIDTGRISLRFKVDCQGFGAVPPSGFMELYLGHNNHRDYMCYEFKIVVDTEFKLGALVTRKGWEYYEWIDSFMRKVEQYASSTEYFKKINWNANLTMFKVLQRTSKLPKS